nr:hypothetical protein BaRGS_027150 [Batillaria attramentaria]
MSFDFPWSVPDACYGQSQLRDLAGQISDSYSAAESGLGPRGPDFGTPPPLIYAGDLLADQPRPDNGQSASTRHTANIWEAYYNDVERELTVGDPEVGSGQRRESETGEIVDEEGNSDDDDDDDDNDMSDGDDDSDDDEGSLTMNDSDDDEGSLTMNDSTCGEDSPDGEKDECEKQKLQSCASG